MTDGEIRRFFAVTHLPEHLVNVAKPFLGLAEHLSNTVPRCGQLDIAFQRLLEARDATLRALK